MPVNPMVAEVAAAARLLGQKPPEIDHVEYVRWATRGMVALEIVLRVVGPTWLEYAYKQAVFDMTRRQGRTVRVQPLGGLDGEDVDPADLRFVAQVAPSRWPGEAALKAASARRVGRVIKLIRACHRIQLAMERNGVTPVGRATRVGDDGRTRGLFLAIRETEIWRESERFPLWGPPGTSADARATPPAEATREVEDEGWGL